MPRRGSAFGEKERPPLDKGELQGGLEMDPPRRSATGVATCHPSAGGDLQEREWLSRRRTTRTAGERHPGP
jgi:hypothetical protein